MRFNGVLSRSAKRRGLVSKRTALLSIILVVWGLWLAGLGVPQAFLLLLTNWKIELTMFFGSIIAGGTSLGGGAVAFPIFTKVLGIIPQDAKVFSLAIQSIGMSAASLAILVTGIQVEWRVLMLGSIGGAIGMFVGLTRLAPYLPPDAIRVSFSLMLASFAITLFALNRNRCRHCHATIPRWGWKEKGICLIAGLIGGVMSGLVGNGIDISVFAVTVLLFRVNEKVATPTSVVLMAVNAAFGTFLQVFYVKDFSDPVLSYWLSAIPVVVVGAPLGAMVCSFLSRELISNILLALISIELLTSILLIPMRLALLASGVLTLAIFSSLNYWMYTTKSYELLLFHPQKSIQSTKD